MTALRLAFLGTPDFAVPSLRALAAAGHQIVQVYSQPARPAGRGQQLKDSPVAALAKEQGWPLATPLSLKGEEERQRFAALKLDVAIVVAYGLILPAAILAAPRLGCLNVHASLLPRWRGAAPIQRAIEAGDAQSGITIMQMDEGLDTGAMLSQSRLPITPTMTGGQLHDLLAELGARQIVQTLDDLAAGKIAAVAQPSDGVTYAKKLSKEEARINWSQPAEDLERRLRAFTPWPGAFFYLGAERIKLLAATLVTASGQPGEVLDDNLTVACGKGALKLERLQREGRKAMEAAEFQRGLSLAKGTRLS